MKRGQLAAVIIIVLLVAAVGGFIIFSEKRAGRAATLSASGTQNQQMAIPVPRGYNPPPAVLPCMSDANCPSGFICVSFICVPGQKPLPPSQPVPGPQPPSQPLPPTPGPEVPPAEPVPPTISPAERTAESCGKTTTTIKCHCQNSREVSGHCGGDMEFEYPFRGSLGGKLYGQSSISYELETDLIDRLVPKDTTFWSCSWYNVRDFTITVEGDLCGKEAAQIAACKEAAKTQKECKIPDGLLPAIDKALDECAKDAESKCVRSDAFSISTPISKTYAGIIKGLGEIKGGYIR